MVLERFRNRVTFKELSGSPDGFGGSSGDVETDRGTVWAKVERMKGNEAFTLQQLLNSIPYLVTIRFHALPDNFTLSTYKVEVDGKLFNIHANYKDEYNRFIKLICWSSEDDYS